MDEKVDVLVLGSGIGGLRAALEAARSARVLVLSKRGADDTNTARAQGGIAAAVGEGDSLDAHVEDTLTVGAGLCDAQIVRQCVREAPDDIEYLAGIGVPFARSGEGSRYDLGQEGGHSRRRVLHSGDFTGRRVEEALLAAVRANPNITLRENVLAVDLINLGRLEGESQEDRIIGAYVMDRASGAIQTVEAAATIVATGGSGKVYLYTSNSDVATGDGVAMGWRAGATIANMEFFQFHPTCLFHPTERSFLISEAVRGEGGALLTRSGDRFAARYHPLAELGPRDVVARAIDSELKRSGDDHVLLDISHKPRGFVEKRFPQIFSRCLELGIDIRKEPIPVVPAAHYQCGGIKVDKNGWTGMPGLYAVGEVACTGMHGANRLASNSLLEAMVFGRRAGRTVLKWLREVPPAPRKLPSWNTGLARNPDEAVVISQNWDEIRRFMWNYVGLVRTDNRLARARKRLSAVRDEVVSDYWSFILTPDLVELRNLSDVAYLILEMAAMRKESRGLHYNLDYPAQDDARWRCDSIMRRPGVRR
jgi:L-aspartate oxidase